MKEATITQDRFSWRDDLYDNTFQDYYYCQECEFESVMRGFNYCPNCGVKIKWDLKK